MSRDLRVSSQFSFSLEIYTFVILFFKGCQVHQFQTGAVHRFEKIFFAGAV
jgi:hypothetical protein